MRDVVTDGRSTVPGRSPFVVFLSKPPPTAAAVTHSHTFTHSVSQTKTHKEQEIERENSENDALAKREETTIEKCGEEGKLGSGSFQRNKTNEHVFVVSLWMFALL
ncbi:hypothetical protein CBL_10704 [Carabus blaptoides fortunei]